MWKPNLGRYRAVEFVGRNIPVAPRRVTKRDVIDAFKRVAKSPDCASILRTGFAGDDIGFLRDIVVFRLALPFGRWDSPG